MQGVKQLELLFDTVPLRERPGTLRRVGLATGVLQYRFVRARRRTIGIFVHRGEVEARAPRWVSVAEVEAFMRAKARWISRRLAEARTEPAPFRWAEGARLPLLGRSARLTAAPGAPAVHQDGDRLMLPMGTIARWRELTLDWLRGSALVLFGERVRHYAALLGVAEPSLGLSNAQTQWGSCWRRRGKHGRVLLNWRLYHLPPRLIDYVVAHELAHLRELNHSARFWAVVESIYPDYRAARIELNQSGRLLPLL